MGNGVFGGIAQDKIITCKLNFTDIELNEKYSISFFGGFRPVSFRFLQKVAGDIKIRDGWIGSLNIGLEFGKFSYIGDHGPWMENPIRAKID